MRRVMAAIADNIRCFMGSLRFPPDEDSSNSLMEGSMERPPFAKTCTFSHVGILLKSDRKLFRRNLWS